MCPRFGRGQRERFRGVKSGGAVGLAEQEGPGGAQLQIYWAEMMPCASVRWEGLSLRPRAGQRGSPGAGPLEGR